MITLKHYHQNITLDLSLKVSQDQQNIIVLKDTLKK